MKKIFIKIIKLIVFLKNYILQIKIIFKFYNIKDKYSIIFFHRTKPYSVGYGAGTKIPLIARKKKFKVLNIYFNFRENIFTNKDTIFIYSFYLLRFVLRNVSQKIPIHIFNQQHMGDITEFIYKLGFRNIILEIRSPLIKKSIVRREDFNKAFKFSKKVIYPSIQVLKTWGFKEKNYQKVLKVPVCISQYNKNVNPLLYKKRLKFIYFGTNDIKRNLSNLIKNIKLLRNTKNRFDFTFLQENDEKKVIEVNSKIRIHYKKYINMSETKKFLQKFNIGISYLPKPRDHANYSLAWPTKVLDYAHSGILPICNYHESHLDMKKSGFKLVFFDEIIDDSFLTKLDNMNDLKIKSILLNNFKISKKFLWENYENTYYKCWKNNL